MAMTTCRAASLIARQAAHAGSKSDRPSVARSARPTAWPPAEAVSITRQAARSASAKSNVAMRGGACVVIGVPPRLPLAGFGLQLWIAAEAAVKPALQTITSTASTTPMPPRSLSSPPPPLIVPLLSPPSEVHATPPQSAAPVVGFVDDDVDDSDDVSDSAAATKAPTSLPAAIMATAQAAAQAIASTTTTWSERGQRCAAKTLTHATQPGGSGRVLAVKASVAKIHSGRRNTGIAV
jgi:hypothetical protein